MLTTPFFGVNLMTLMGFIRVGLGLALRSMANAGFSICGGLMCARSAFVLLGRHAGGWPH